MKLSCPKIVKLDKTKPEVGDDAHNLPGGSLKLQDLSGIGERDNKYVSLPLDGKERSPKSLVGGVKPEPKPSAQKLPDPWLFDSEALLRELDRIRETALQVPTNGDANATHFGLQLVINAAWTLRENIRYILALHREGQRAVRNKQGRDTKHQTIYALLNWVGITC